MLARPLLATFLAAAALPSSALAADSSSYNFQTNGAFFSAQTQQSLPLDPQVFVPDPPVSGGPGPQGIVHAAGFSPAPLTDPPSTVLANANGKPLPFTLSEWLSAGGSASIAPLAGGAQRVELRFSHLIPRGVYSVFENQVTASGTTVAPLDGTGTTNTFTAGADGSAAAAIVSPEPFAHATAILLVYHSDGQSHGMQVGTLGVDAHQQLIVRFPYNR